MWRYWIALISLAVVWIVLQGSVSGSRVYELSDRFLDIYKKDSRSWLVKFYAPWCHYCRQLEPVYMQVAQTLANEGSEVVVGRIDCTRFTAVTTTFPVKGFPTILFIHPDYIVEYDGDRTKEEITDFARRLSGPPIRPLLDCKSVDESLSRHGVFFLYIGHPISDNFTKTAGKYRSLNWFYHLNSTACPGLTQPGSYVIKGKPPDDKIIERFQDTLPLAEPLSTSNGEEYSISKSPSMNEWVRKEMFPQFGKVTSGNFNRLLKTGKILVLSVVEELIPVERLASGKHQEFRDLLEAVALTYEDRKPFIFGWTSSLDLVNSITLYSIRTLPSFVVINSSDLTYSVREGSIPPQDIIDILISLGKGEFDDFSGGNSWWTKIRRALFDALVSFVNMYHGNPVLTLLLFGLPLSFFAFIIYSAFFSDMLDAPDDEEEEELVEDHEKKD